MRDQLYARKMWVSGEGTHVVSIKGEDGWKEKELEKILEVRRWRIWLKSGYLHSCKGLGPFGSMWQLKGGCKEAFDLPCLLRATVYCIYQTFFSKHEAFLHVLQGCSSTRCS